MNNVYYEKFMIKSFEKLNYEKICNDVLNTDASHIASEKRLKDMLSPKMETKSLAYTLTRLMIFLYEKGNIGLPLPDWADKFNTFIENKFGDTDNILSAIINLSEAQDKDHAKTGTEHE